MQKKNTLILVTLLSLLLTGCPSGSSPQENYTRTLQDALGREVTVPDTVRSVIGLRSGALRLICYMGAADKVHFVEGNETRRQVPYLMANPELIKKELIGTGNIIDYELLAASSAEVLIVTYYTPEEADELSRLTGKPVFGLEYGDLEGKRDDLELSLRKLGELFHKEARARQLIEGMRNLDREFRNRTAGIPYQPQAYIGGVAYRGSHGIRSTQGEYSPFRMLGISNPASVLEQVVSSPVASQENAFIDLEQVLKWNTDYVFLDVSGEEVWTEQIRKMEVLQRLKAFQKQNVYRVLPYNWYTTNFENLYCNAWYIGKVVYPEAFADIDPVEECRKIYRFFLGKDVFDEMDALYSPYRPVVRKEEAGQ